MVTDGDLPKFVVACQTLHLQETLLAIRQAYIAELLQECRLQSPLAGHIFQTHRPTGVCMLWMLMSSIQGSEANIANDSPDVKLTELQHHARMLLLLLLCRSSVQL